MNDFTNIQPYSPSCACGHKKVKIDYDASLDPEKTNLKVAYLCRLCDLNLAALHA